jgi:hypothetical protein
MRMKTFIKLVALALLLPAVAFAQTTPVNEWTTNVGPVEDPSYIKKGDGINYESAPDVFMESDVTIVDNGSTYDVTAVPLAWSLSKSSGDIVYTRDALSTTFAFSGVLWVELESQDVTAIDPSPDTSNISIDGTTITYTDLYPGINATVTSTVSGPQVTYTISSTSGWATHSYVQTVYLSFWHELKSKGHTIKTDGTTWDGTTLTPAITVSFHGTTKQFDVIRSIATDTNGDTTDVDNILLEGPGNKDYFVQGVLDSWFSGATLPVVVE